VHVPEVVREHSSRRVLTMEFIDGCKITNAQRLKEMGADTKEMARLMVETFSRQIFHSGFVHCDPHPGNVFVRPMPGHPGQHQLVLLDHGLYRELPETFRRNYCAMWKALVMRDDAALKRHSHALGVDNWELFAVLLLMRPYRGSRIGLPPLNLSRKEAHKMMHDLVGSLDELVNVMKQMPRELLLVLRNTNLVRSVNRELGTPVNRFVIMAEVAAQGLGIERAHEKAGRWCQRLWRWMRMKREQLWFRTYLLGYGVMYRVTDAMLGVLVRYQPERLDPEIAAQLQG
jgi:aarF domain-containing kinase